MKVRDQSVMALRFITNGIYAGTIVQGTLKCKKSERNSRELDVEIHYMVHDDPENMNTSSAIVQIYKVR